mgnify:CR=1 FL=1
MPIYATKFVLVNKNNEYMSQKDILSNNLVFGEAVTTVELQDEAGGYFFEIKQPPNPWNAEQEQCVRLGFDEIEDLFQAITKLKEESERSLK